MSLSQQRCFYCGAPPSTVKRGGYGRYGDFVYNGVDRVVNEEGYSEANCVPCCAPCNKAKYTRTAAEFVTWALRLKTKIDEGTFGQVSDLSFEKAPPPYSPAQAPPPNPFTDAPSRLTILRRWRSGGKHSAECRCTCGKIIKTNYYNAASGNTRSCGCLRADFLQHQAKVLGCFRLQLSPGEAAFNSLFSGYRRDAAKRRLVFNISKDIFRSLVQRPCSYCDQKPANMAKTRHLGSGAFIYSGLDRVDSTKGYTLANIIPSCATCNKAKLRMTLPDFKTWVLRLCAFQESRTAHVFKL